MAGEAQANSVIDLTGILGQVDADRLLRAIYSADARSGNHHDGLRLRECHVRGLARRAGIPDDVPLAEPVTLFGRHVEIDAEPDRFPLGPVVSYGYLFTLYQRVG